MSPATRTEQDLLGEVLVPADALYGVHTARARANFPITGVAISSHPELLGALAAVKEAASRANADLGLLDPAIAAAIARACQEIRDGRWHDHFVVDVLQGGAGTSTNMNANEVIANRALAILGLPAGSYDVIHPVEHVNLSQSTNDVYPTAARLAVHEAIRVLRAEVVRLAEEFRSRARQFAGIVKVGRTQLQDAVPLTVGQELGAHASTLEADVAALDWAASRLTVINLGGTAIGTGLNAPAGYAKRACRHLRESSGVQVTLAEDSVSATQDAGAFVHASAAVKCAAIHVSKVCNDLRLLASGPHAGLAEVRLPAVQAGSSIMPGKVNPVIPEMVNQVAFEVVGNDLTVTMAAEAGQLQLNAFEPAITHKLLTSIDHLARACRLLRECCVAGMDVNQDVIEEMVERSDIIATALNPIIGYSAASRLAHEASDTGVPIATLVRRHGLLTDEQLSGLLRPELMT